MRVRAVSRNSSDRAPVLSAPRQYGSWRSDAGVRECRGSIYSTIANAEPRRSARARCPSCRAQERGHVERRAPKPRSASAAGRPAEVAVAAAAGSGTIEDRPARNRQSLTSPARSAAAAAAAPGSASQPAGIGIVRHVDRRLGAGARGRRAGAAWGPKPVAITVIFTLPLSVGSTTAPKMMLASSCAAS